MIKHNKGERNKLYIFLKLPGDGIFFAADV